MMMSINRSISPEDAIDLGIDPEPAERVPESHFRGNPGSSNFCLEPGPPENTFGGSTLYSEISGDAGPAQSVLRCDAGRGHLSRQARSPQSRFGFDVVKVRAVIPGIPG